MSGIPGFFNRDGRPADAAIAGRMIGAAPYRGPDGARCWTSGAVAIGHQRLRIQPDDVPQPIQDASRDVVIAFDGRIDNRMELIGELASGATAFRTPSDAEIVLDAYGRWGEECPGRLLGDFAFVIWDGPRRSVFCARDVMGIKPFFYHLDEHAFVWASDLRQILASGYVPALEPNEGMVAEYLSFHLRTLDETFYKGVMRLPAAHTLTVSADHFRIRRYWQLDPGAELNYGREEDYADRCRELFTEAVRCRLPRESRSVGAYLSGGLDSSSVVAVASSLGWSVDAFSLTFPDDDRADESRYIDDVVARWRLSSHRLDARPVDAGASLALISSRGDVPDLPSDLIGEDLRALMPGRGHRVVLTGIGGDYDFGGTYYHYADLIEQRKFGGLGRQLLADIRTADRLREPFRELLMSGIRPLLPQGLRNILKPLAAGVGLAPPKMSAWVGEPLATRVGLADRLRPPASGASGGRAGRASTRYFLELFGAAWPYLILDRVDRYAAERGIEERHPFFDRRMIEFALAIPESQRWQGEHTKFVLRRAMGGMLPASVAGRTDKADFSRAVPAAVEALGGARVLDHLHIASLGWVQQDQVSRKYHDALRLFAKDAEWYCREMFHLWMILGVELWYRTVFLGVEKNGRPDETRRSEGRAWPAGAGQPGSPQVISLS